MGFLCGFTTDDIVDECVIAGVRDYIPVIGFLSEAFGHCRFTVALTAAISDAGDDVGRNSVDEVLPRAIGRCGDDVRIRFASGQAFRNRRPELVELVGVDFEDIVHLIIRYVHVTPPLMPVVWEFLPAVSD